MDGQDETGGDYVSTILRLHKPEKLDRLELALLSLCGQRHPFLAPIVVLQDFDDAAEAEVRKVADRLPWRPEARAVEIVNLRGLPDGDHRARLLNAGLEAATGDYIGFLDYDDILYPNAYCDLVERIRRSGHVAAFGAATIADIDPGSPGGACPAKRPFPVSKHKYEFFKRNIYPIHSFLVRRDAATDIRVPEHLQRLEDYHFLLSVLKDHDWDDELIGKPPICEYVNWTDGSNALPGEGDAHRRLLEARAEIAAYKESLQISFPLPRLLSLIGSASSDTLPMPLPTAGALGPAADLSSRFIGAIRPFLPFVGLWHRLEGGFDRLDWDGFHASYGGVVRLPDHLVRPAIGLVFATRPSSLRPSFRFIAQANFQEPCEAGKAATFDGRAAVPWEHLTKGRDRLVLFLVTGDGRLFRAAACAMLEKSQHLRIDDAA